MLIPPNTRKYLEMARGVLLNGRFSALELDKHMSVPEGRLVDPSIKSVWPKDWRRVLVSKLNERCSGQKGLEIGALHQPLDLPSTLPVDYLDYCTVEELRKKYPELENSELTEPDIIENAETLRSIGDESYGFVAAAHVIEHMRNPIGAVENWLRVLRPGGTLYLAVPDKRATFDRLRLRNSLEHLILDYKMPSLERDKEHFLEYASLVEGASGLEALDRAKKLEEDEVSIHFHVFLAEDVVAMLEWMRENLSINIRVEGPWANPGAFEFHLLITKEA